MPDRPSIAEPRAPSRGGRARGRSTWALALGLACGLQPSPADADPGRWPAWPTEIRRVAAPLVRDAHGKPLGGERQRIAAIQALDTYATGAILDPLIHALEDGSAQVRREALRMCFEREVVACIPGAANLWSEGGEPTVRVAALQVLSLDPDPSRAAILIEALRDPSEVIRAQSAELLGAAPLTPDVRKRVRTALLAKLADVSVVVRRRAVTSLGQLGPGEGTLSIARLLDDPEPSVRAAAAEALGHDRSETAVPSLRRAITAPNEPAVARAIIDALAVMPDPTVEVDLLGLLDDPPTGLDEGTIADAIGRRPDPGSTLLQGLVARLDEPDRSAAALHALLLLGEDARPTLQQARERGLAPPIDVEVQRLLAALDPDAASGSTPRPWPEDEDQPAWQQRLDEGSALQRMRAAWALAQRDPAWRAPAAAAMIARPGPVVGRRAWALTLAGSPTPWGTDDDTITRARLEGWARDRTVAAADRCLALAALGAHAPPPGRHADTPWADLAADPSPHVRACAALALGRQGDPTHLAGLLVDPHARVRTAAALALASIPARRRDRSTIARLTMLAHEDPQAPVRAAASYALEVTPDGASTAARAPGLWMLRVEPFAWRDPAQWIEIALDDRRLWLPAEGTGPWRWSLVAGTAAAVPLEGAEIVSTVPSDAAAGQLR